MATTHIFVCVGHEDKPRLRLALIFTIFCKPSIVRCSLRFMRSTIYLNKIKSACFCVIKGYLSKCGIIILVKSLRDWTL